MCDLGTSCHYCRSEARALHYYSAAGYTVKPAYKDHTKDQETVVLIHRWSLYAGSITGEVYHWEPVKCGLYKQAPGGLYIQVVFRAGWPIYSILMLLCFRKKSTKESTLAIS